MSACFYMCLVAAVVIIVAQAVVNQNCRYDTDCSKDECCQIPNDSMIISRKRSPRVKDEVNQKNGTCRRYKMESEICHQMEKVNGFCGCSPVLECRRYHILNATELRSRRDMMPRKLVCSFVERCLPPGGTVNCHEIVVVK